MLKYNIRDKQNYTREQRIKTRHEC